MPSSKSIRPCKKVAGRRRVVAGRRKSNKRLEASVKKLTGGTAPPGMHPRDVDWGSWPARMDLFTWHTALGIARANGKKRGTIYIAGSHVSVNFKKHITRLIKDSGYTQDVKARIQHQLVCYLKCINTEWTSERAQTYVDELLS